MTDREKLLADGWSEDDIRDLQVMAEEEKEKVEALELHNEIMINGKMAAIHLVEMCRCLKRMRDERLYLRLDYNDFETYCEEKAGIKSRQAYSYISTYEKLGPKVIEENASLGITKLSLLTQMNPVDRVEVLESGELDTMSTREIEKLVKQTTEQAEQLTMLQAEKEDAEAESEAQSEEITRLKAEINSIKAENEELRNKPTEIAVQMPSEEDLEKIREEIKAEIAVDFQTEKENALAEVKKTATAEAKEKLKKQIEKAESESTAAKAEAEKLKAEISSLTEAGEALKKRLEVASGSGQIIAIYFAELQRVFNSIMDAVNKSADEEQQKYKDALVKAFNSFLEAVRG